MTWEELTGLEPRLNRLFLEAQMVNGDEGQFCANHVWFHSFKPILVELVGWERGGPPVELMTEEAYDLAYDKIYNALPPCRDCGCL